MASRRAPDFVEPMLLSTGSQLPSGAGWLAQLKLDGARGQLRISRGSVELRTRRGRRCESEFPEIVAVSRGLPDVVLDGEIVVLNHNNEPDFAALRTRLGTSAKRAAHSAALRPATFFAFDVLWHKATDLRNRPLSHRRTVLESLPLRGAVAGVDFYAGGAGAVMEFARARRLEGVVVKRADSVYRSGRSAAWQKFKIRTSERLWVTAWRPGRPGELDRYWVGRPVDGRLTPVGEVSFGLKRGQAAGLRRILQAASLDRRRQGLMVVAPVVAMTVEAHGPGGWLRDPIITRVDVELAGPSGG
jgi:bifunctional non-homologous end joining protein LigD